MPLFWATEAWPDLWPSISGQLTGDLQMCVAQGAFQQLWWGKSQRWGVNYEAPFLQGPMGWLGSFSEGPSSRQEAARFWSLFPPLSHLQVWSLERHHLLWKAGYCALSYGFPACSAPWWKVFLFNSPTIILICVIHFLLGPWLVLHD